MQPGMNILTTQRRDPLSNVRSRTPPLAQSEIDYGLLGDLVGFSVKLAWVLGHACLAREIGDPAITPHRYSLLEVIGRNPGLQQTQLAAALALSRPATTLGINFWEERGCVDRRTVPGDRRSFGIYTTPHGEQELERLRKVVREADAGLTADLTAAEREELRRLLKKIHR